MKMKPIISVNTSDYETEDMKTKLIALLAVLLFSAGANAQNAPANEQPVKKILIAYFSWGGNTQHVAEHIAALTGGTLFRIAGIRNDRKKYRRSGKLVESDSCHTING